VLDLAYACPQKVAERDHHRGPHGSAKDVVEGEFSPAHPACVGDQSAEHAQAGEEASQEYGLASMPLEERFGASQPPGGDEDVATPWEDEGTPPPLPTQEPIWSPNTAPKMPNAMTSPRSRCPRWIKTPEARSMGSPGKGTPVPSSITPKGMAR
jgi:hypothetical protein